MKTDLFFNPAQETPAPGSLLDRYHTGEISGYAVNWAFVCGLDVAQPSDLDALAVADVEDCALRVALDVAAETTQGFPEADAIAGYGLVSALVARASVHIGNKGQRLQAIRAAMGGRLAWAIATKELRRVGYPAENLPAHLSRSGAATVGIAGPLSQRGVGHAGSRLGLDINRLPFVAPSAIAQA